MHNFEGPFVTMLEGFAPASQTAFLSFSFFLQNLQFKKVVESASASTEAALCMAKISRAKLLVAHYARWRWITQDIRSYVTENYNQLCRPEMQFNWLCVLLRHILHCYGESAGNGSKAASKITIKLHKVFPDLLPQPINAAADRQPSRSPVLEDGSTTQHSASPFFGTDDISSLLGNNDDILREDEPSPVHNSELEWDLELDDQAEADLEQLSVASGERRSIQSIHSANLADCSASFFIKNRFAEGQELKESAVKHVLSVVAQWVGLQNCKDINVWEMKGSILDVLFQTFKCTQFLLLDEVFRAYERPLRYVFPKRGNADYAHLQLCISEVLRVNSRLLDELQSVDLSPPLDTDTLAQFIPHLVNHTEIVQQDPVAESHSSTLMNHSPSAHPTPSPPSSSANNYEVPMGKLIALWDLLVPLLENPQKKYSKHDSREWVKENRDKRLPFREAAPSRVAVLVHDPANQQPSPFSPALVDMVEGFFSAVIFRGYTYNCNILLEEGKRFFPDPESWESLEEKYKRNPKFLCDMGAYGTAISTRTLGKARMYWEASKDWIKWKKKMGTSLSFATAWAHLKNDKNLNGFGPLVTYLLMVDLVYAGSLPMPRIEAFAGLVLKLNRGATKALRRLGVIPTDGSTDTAQNIQSFVGFYLCVEKFLREKEDEGHFVPHFDIFVFEHLLCKFVRFTDKFKI